MTTSISYKSLPIDLQNNKPGKTRAHTIVVQEEQLEFVRNCIEFTIANSPALKDVVDIYDNPMGEFLVNMIGDTLNLTEEEYDYDTIHGYCI